MELAILGLGKMGFNLMENLLDHKHEVVAFDIDHNLVEQAEAVGAKGATSIQKVFKQLDGKKIIWMMVPAGEITEKLIVDLKPYLSEEDILIDGGNSNYKDTVKTIS